MIENKPEIDDMHQTSILNETMVSGIYFDPIFAEMRERGKGNWTIPPEAKEALEKSIDRGTVSVKAENGAIYAGSGDLSPEKEEKA